MTQKLLHENYILYKDYSITRNWIKMYIIHLQAEYYVFLILP